MRLEIIGLGVSNALPKLVLAPLLWFRLPPLASLIILGVETANREDEGMTLVFSGCEDCA